MATKKQWLINTILLLVLYTGDVRVAAQRCPGGWEDLVGGDQCFYYGNEQLLNWYEARLTCQALGADLVVIDSATKNRFLTSNSDDSQQYWIGLQRETTDADDWEWVDGTTTNEYENWSDQQSDEGDCAIISQYDGRWSNRDCLQAIRYICQRTKDIVIKCDTTDGWQSLNNKCYKYESGEKSWQNAVGQCENHKAQLVTVNNQAEQDFVTTMAKASFESRVTGGTGAVWIGLSDASPTNDGYYYWVDGSRLEITDFTNWASGQPDDQGGGCIEVLSTASDGEWNNGQCSREREFVCEKDEGTCASGWSLYSGQCYQFNVFYQSTWIDAKTMCEAQGGYLATVNNNAENEFLLTQFESLYEGGITDVWIGISDYITDGLFAWANGETLRYQNWATQQPLDNAGSPDCGSIHTGSSLGQWETTNCFKLQSFVCEIKEGLPVVPINPGYAIGSCEIGWELHGDYCYQFQTLETDFNTARTNCQRLGADLASITSDEEQSFITGRVDIYRTRLYIGLTDLTQDFAWEWLDGSPYQFQNWAPGEPSNSFGGDEDCVHVDYPQSKLGMWNDLRCTKKEGSICKKAKSSSGGKVTVIPTTFPLVFDARCGEGWDWEETLATCYKFYVDQTKSWTDARDECRKSGGDLLSISNLNEQTYVNARLVGKNVAVLWIGATDMTAEGGWEWSDGTPFAYLNWNSGEPNNVGDEDCAEVIVSTGKWNDIRCSEPRAFICENHGVLTTHFNVYHDSYLDGYDDVVLRGLYPDDCAQECLNRATCKSFDYDINTKTCALSDTNKDLVGENLKSSDPSAPEDYYQLIDNPPTDAIPTTLPIGYGCTDGWEAYGSKCYGLLTDKMSWNDAKTECRRLGGDITSIHDKNENNFLLSTIQFACDSFHTDSTENLYQYQWISQALTTTRVTFEVKANNDAHIALSPLEQDQNPMYEIVIGGWGNQQSVIRRCSQCPNQAVAPTQGYLDRNEWREFWITFNGGLIRVGKGGEEDAFIEWQDPNPISVNYVGYSTGFGSDGEFRICTQHTATDDRFWLGLNNQEVEMVYEWSDGTGVTYTKWANNEPDYYNTDKCVNFYLEGSNAGAWNNEDCTNQYKAVCKRDVELLPIVTATTIWPSDSPCDKGWTAYYQSCYLFESEQLLSWTEADSKCATFGGNLITVNDNYEQAFLSSRLSSFSGMFWIGLNDRNTPGSYQWADGSPVTYTNWARGQPDNSLGNCVVVEEGETVGLWSHRGCELPQYYVCEKLQSGVTAPKATTALPTQPSGTGCSTDWYGYGSYCYKAINIYDTWENSELGCQGYAGHLVSFHSPEEELYIKTQLSIDSPIGETYWIGLNDRTLENGFEWSDGSITDYITWNPGEPNDYNFYEDCVETNLFTDNGWNDNDCNTYRSSICKVAKFTPPPTTISAPTGTRSTANCGNSLSWIYYGHSDACYYFSSGYGLERDDWDGAEKFCNSYGGHLVSIHSQSEQNFITSEIQKLYEISYWIGYRIYSFDGTFEWIDKSPVDFDYWKNGEPNNYLGAEECAETVTYDGKWNDVSCFNALPFICKKSVGDESPITQAPTQELPGNCQFPWFEYGNKCYRFSDYTYDVQSAQLQCQYDSGELASIKSNQFQTFLITKMRDLGLYKVWIGLTSAYSSDGAYQWFDGSPLTYTNWAPGEPNNYGEYCVEMYANGDYVGAWNDNLCYNYNNYLCQRDKDTTLPDQTEPPGNCQDGFVQYGESCWSVLETTGSYQSAKQACELQQSTLASILDVYENAFVTTLVHQQGQQQPLWIGFNDLQNTGTYQWLDGSSVTFTNWDSNEPSTDVGEGCVQISEYGYWNDTDCSSTTKSVCKYYLSGNPITLGPPLDGDCPDSTWSKYGSNCYQFISSSQKDWPNAEFNCIQMGAHLASVHSEDENQYIYQMYTQQYSGPNHLWLGLTRGASGGFQWIDGSPVGYDNWNVGEPSNQQSGYEDCVELYGVNGAPSYWNDIACSAQMSYVCKMPVATPTTLQAQTLSTTESVCGGDLDWYYDFSTLDACYFFSSGSGDEAEDWDGAQEFCNTHAGHLVSIHQQLEQDFIYNTIAFKFPTVYWIGLREKDRGQPYEWADQTPLDYINWSVGQPDDYLGQEQCAELMQSTGEWNDQNCGAKQAFICKKDVGRNIPITQPPPSPYGNCPSPWFEYENRCYGFFNIPSTWDEAMATCRNNGKNGNLVTIHSAKLQFYLMSRVKGKDWMWIGLNDRSTQNRFRWVDGSGVDYTNWNSGEPNGQNLEDCCQMYTNEYSLGLWNDLSCSTVGGYICQMDKDLSLPTQEPPINNCNYGFTQFDDDCWLLVKSYLPFDKAHSFCEPYGDLASIVDIYENAYMTSLLLETDIDDAWIGLHDDKTAGDYVWSDKSLKSFTSWAYGEPSQSAGEGCVALTKSGSWDDTDCNLDKWFFCKYRLEDTVTATTRPTTHSSTTAMKPKTSIPTTTKPMVTKGTSTVITPNPPPKTTGSKFNPTTRPTFTPNVGKNQSPEGGLSVGAIMGIVIGIVFILALVLAAVFYTAVKSRGSSTSQEQITTPLSFNNALYSSQGDAIDFKHVRSDPREVEEV